MLRQECLSIMPICHISAVQGQIIGTSAQENHVLDENSREDYENHPMDINHPYSHNAFFPESME